MAPNRMPKFIPDSQPITHYAICVRGRLNGTDWAEWFDGLAIEADDERGITCLRGLVADQAELYGLLSRLRNLGLALISVEPIELKE